MSLISLYREFLADEERVADYFLMDSQYLANVAEMNNFDTGDFEQNVERQENSIRKGRLNREPEYFLRMMDAEAKWPTASFRWKKTPFRHVMILGTELAGRRVRSAKNRITDEMASRSIRYSRPTDFLDVDARKDFGDGSSFGEAILHLDWLEYVAQPTEIRLDDKLIRKTRKETLQYYFEGRDSLSEEVENLQLSLWANDVEWIENLHRYYSDSGFFQEIADNITSGVEYEFGVKLDDYRNKSGENLLDGIFQD